jgi:hypothetical protein
MHHGAVLEGKRWVTSASLGSPSSKSALGAHLSITPARFSVPLFQGRDSYPAGDTDITGASQDAESGICLCTAMQGSEAARHAFEERLTAFETQLRSEFT